MKKFISRYKVFIIVFSLLLAIAYYVCLPDKLFNEPYSTVLEARNSDLLCASIAGDGQWRFPELHEVPDKFATALVAYEDKRFFNHPGVDILSMARAMRQNISKGRIVSGGSTIDMQVIRLHRKETGRTVVEKFIESVLATRLQFRYSKKEILSLYASHAPFGGNVVGLEAACWRYFGREPKELSWAEAAMLAVLPNAPALIHPAKNRDKLFRKRNMLLLKLKNNQVIDSLTYQLSVTEPIPDEPLPLPRIARHVLLRATADGMAQQKIRSTIDLALQERVEQILDDHYQRLKGNQIHNACALVLDVETGNVLAYAGNVNSGAAHGYDVDLISAPRSTGSILKPFLYAAMLDDGKILSRTLLPDIPTVISGFAPKNFTKEYDGAVPADQALIRSLNVPAVYLLQEYRYERFHQLLKNMGLRSLTRPADHYGLSLILGGAEGSVWDITGMYASMARTLNHYFTYPGKNRYTKNDFHAPVYRAQSGKDSVVEESSWLSAAAIYQTMDVLKEVYRPGEETGWRYFKSAKRIAWKTGTSFGFRDGWAVGVTPQYAVGIWVGNADGEGRPGLTGTETASPIMFDIFSQLNGNAWFSKPLPEMTEVVTCSKSGQLFGQFCEKPDTVLISKQGQVSGLCTFHKSIHLGADKKFRVHSECESLARIVRQNWFVLPPVQEYYYKAKNITYKTLPPFRADCQPLQSVTSMDLIYPKPNARIFIPRDLDGEPGSVIFELAHRSSATTVYWHMDGEFIGSTKKVHHMALNPPQGKHLLTLVDETGEALERHFEIISKR
jgi:penicillin-binding protein 1C